MPYCGPAFAIPSCASSPVVGFGSSNLGYGGLRGSAFGYGGLIGGGVPSASLGILAGVEPSGINQIPPAEVTAQPPPVVLTIPGPILSATGEPVSVGGNTPCAVSYGGFGGSPVALRGGALGGGALRPGFGLGFGSIYGLGGRGSLILGRPSTTCLSPC